MATEWVGGRRGLAVAGGLVAAVVAAVVGMWLLGIAYGAAPQWMLDFRVYRAGGLAVRDGADLYAVTATPQHLPFTYPPFAALLFAPFAAVPLAVSGPVSVVVNLLLLQAVVARALRLEGVPYGGRVAVAAVSSLGLMWLPPVRWTLQLGQVNILLMALVLLDLTAAPGGRWRRWTGAWAGVAAGIKLAPGLFLLYLLLRGRYRAFATGVAAFAVTVAAGFAAVPGDSARYWGGVFADATRTAVQVKTSEQDLRAVLVRVLHGAPDVPAYWIPAALVVAAFGLAVAVRLARRGDEMSALLACAGTGLLISPVSWEHHWVWAIPLIAALAARAAVPRHSTPDATPVAGAAPPSRGKDGGTPEADAERVGAGPGGAPPDGTVDAARGLGQRARRWVLGGAAVVVAGCVAVRPEVWGVPDPHAPLHLTPIQLFWSSWLAVVTLALLVAGLVVSRQRSATRVAGRSTQSAT